MAYWLVFQRKTFREEREGGYLWAPRTDIAGRPRFFWTNMLEVQPGDTIFSYVHGKIVAVSSAQSKGVEAKRPQELPGELEWRDEGWQLYTNYVDLTAPLSKEAYLQEIRPMLPAKYNPFSRTDRGNQGYLYSLPPRAGRFLIDHIDGVAPGLSHKENGTAAEDTPPVTSRLSNVELRVGHGKFRAEVRQRWGGVCSVTGVGLDGLLVASHIKPWRDANDHERLDPDNGLLLSPAYDALFDKGYIGFRPTGDVVFSPSLNPEQAKLLGVAQDAKVEGLSDGNKEYLAYHLREVLRG
jgi:hypothetical protein